MRAFFLAFVLLICAASAHAQNAIQTLVQTLGAQTFNSSQQVVPLATAQDVLLQNKAWADARGWAATLATDHSSLTFTDPVSGWTITQSYIADPYGFYKPGIPRPIAGAKPNVPYVAATIGAGTAKIFVFGQSHDDNSVAVRYTSKFLGFNFAYADGGNFVDLSDPLPCAYNEGSADGNIWTRVADYAQGRYVSWQRGLSTPQYINRVVVRCFAIGGTVIENWLPGQTFHIWLVAALNDFVAHVGVPDAIVWDQGDGNAGGGMDQATWVADWLSIVNSLRANVPALASAPPYFWIGQGDICNARGANPDHDVVYRTPDILTASAVGRAAILAAQVQAGNYNGNFRPGPNRDAIVDWRKKALFSDSCHEDGDSADAVAQAWALSLFP